MGDSGTILETDTLIHSRAGLQGNWLTMESERMYIGVRPEKLTCNLVMLLVCVWLLWNKGRRVGGALFALLVTCVSLGTGLRNTKPVSSPDGALA